MGGQAGFISDLDGDLPLYEHFSAGGSSFRGFATRGIGPRDSVTGDALGGKYIATNKIELTFPLPGLDELGINGIMFTDGGIVTGFGSNIGVTDSKTYRVSAGLGVFWRSPMGPLRFEFGIPVVKAKEDRTEIFNFSLGTRF